jgi:hypothetical protein
VVVKDSVRPDHHGHESPPATTWAENGSRECGANFVRARVWFDVRKSLTRFVIIKPEEEALVIMRVKYEKVPRYCSVCGLLGHVKE